MKNEQAELLNTQTTGGNDQNKENSNSELIHREKLENTPFHVIGTKERGYFLALGKYRLTDNKETIDQVKIEIAEQHWNIILKVILTVFEMEEKLKELINNDVDK